MELSWLYAVLNAINKAVNDVISIQILLLTLLVSFSIFKILQYLQWPKSRVNILFWAIWPVIMLLMIKIQLFPDVGITDWEWLEAVPNAFSQVFIKFEPALMIILVTPLLWALGWRIASRKTDYHFALIEFQFGMALLALTFFSEYELGLDQSSSLPVIIIFVTLGLIGISVSHAKEKSWLYSGQRNQWFGILILSLLLIFCIGILISFIVTPDLIQVFLNGLYWVWEMIEKGLKLIAKLFPPQTDASQETIPVSPGMENQDERLFKLPEWISTIFKPIYIIFIGAFLLFTLYRIASDIYKWTRNRSPKDSGDHEILRGAFKRDIVYLIQRVISWLFRKIFRLRIKTGYRDSSEEVASIRQLYAQLLTWGAKKGFTRHSNQTALEYRDNLVALLPEHQSELNMITEQYIAARYGDLHPEKEVLIELRRVWYSLRKLKNVKTRH